MAVGTVWLVVVTGDGEEVVAVGVGFQLDLVTSNWLVGWLAVY